MLDYVKHLSVLARKDYVNDDIFSRTFDMPLYEHVINIFKNFSVIPGLSLEKWEIIPYGRIDTNKNNTKNKIIKSNNRLERLININENKSDILRVTFKKDIDGVVEYETKDIFCPVEDKHHHYTLNGSKVLMLNQIVDSSTYTTDSGELCFRTPIFSFPIILKPVPIIEETVSGDMLKGRCMNIRIFNVESNVIYYYLAKFGIDKTIDIFKLTNIVSVVPKVINEDKYHYLKVSDTIFIEILKEKAKYDAFIMNFAMTLYDGLRPNRGVKSKKKIKNSTNVTVFADLYRPDFWLQIFAETYAVKKSMKAGRSGLLSFERLIDDSSVKKLSSIKIQHRKSIYHMIAYLITNFDELMKKDNFDLINKRVRNNEVIASVFDGMLKNNINAMMNSTDFSKERIDRFLNSLTPLSIQKAMNHTDSGALLRFERFNDNSVIELSRFSMKGLGSIVGGKHKTALPYRDIYPSHLGRLDLSVCSATDPGLTGYLCGNFKITDRGRFSTIKDPNTYEEKMDSIEGKIPVYDEKERKIVVERYKHMDKNGILRLVLIKEENKKNPFLSQVQPRFRILEEENGRKRIVRMARPNTIDGNYKLSFTEKYKKMQEAFSVPGEANPLYTVDGKLKLKELLTARGQQILKEYDEYAKKNGIGKKKK